MRDNVIDALTTQLANEARYAQRRAEGVAYNASHEVLKKGLTSISCAQPIPALNRRPSFPDAHL